MTVPTSSRIVPTFERSEFEPAEVADRRTAERRLHDLFDNRQDIAGSMPPRHERRAAHIFEAIVGVHGARTDTQAPCVVCGYAEAGHPALTDPEREIVTALVNQRQAPAFMRRSILRKLASGLRRR